MTVLDLITEALQICQIVGEADPVRDSYAQLGFKALAGLVDTSNADPLKKFTRRAATFTLIPGQQAYTVGPDATMNFNTARPQEILRANVLDLSVPAIPNRIPIRILTYEQWAAIGVQNVPTAIPASLWYDAGYSQITGTTSGYGTINLHGVPNVANQIELYTAQPLTQASALTDDLIFPPAYYEWMLYALCARLYPRFGRDPDPTVIALGRDALLKLESNNTVTPILQLDSGLPNGRAAYFDARINRYI